MITTNEEVTMKVLKSGKENNFGKELVCKGTGVGKEGGCGALLLVAPGDVKEHSYYSYGDHEVDYYFMCPECHVKTHVSPSSFSKL